MRGLCQVMLLFFSFFSRADSANYLPDQLLTSTRVSGQKIVGRECMVYRLCETQKILFTARCAWVGDRTRKWDTILWPLYYTIYPYTSVYYTDVYGSVTGHKSAIPLGVSVSCILLCRKRTAHVACHLATAYTVQKLSVTDSKYVLQRVHADDQQRD